MISIFTTRRHSNLTTIRNLNPIVPSSNCIFLRIQSNCTCAVDTNAISICSIDNITAILRF